MTKREITLVMAKDLANYFLGMLINIYKGYRIISYNKEINGVDMPCWTLQKRLWFSWIGIEKDNCSPWVVELWKNEYDLKRG